MTDYNHWQSSLVDLAGFSYPPVGRSGEIKLTPNEIVNFYDPIEGFIVAALPGGKLQ